MAAATVTPFAVKHPAWKLTYAGKVITADISGMMLEVTFTDHEGHIGNDIEVKLADNEKRWQGPWYPQQGDLLNLQIGYRGESPNLHCGDFNIHELELDGPPDTFHIRAL